MKSGEKNELSSSITKGIMVKGKAGLSDVLSVLEVEIGFISEIRNRKSKIKSKSQNSSEEERQKPGLFFHE